MTGTSVRIIHSGLLPERMKASMILRRLASFLGFNSLVDSAISTFNSAAMVARSILRRISRMASAPIMAVKES